MHMRINCLAAMALMMQALFCLGSEETPETVHRLAEQLGSDDFDQREAASKALLAIGESAWPELEPFLKSDSPEVVLRVRKLARGLAIVLKEQEPLLKELLAKLHDQTDEMKRAEGLDGLLGLGPGGERLLKKQLSGQGAQPKVELEFERQVLKPGEKVAGKARLLNIGAAPFWLEKSWRGLETKSIFHRPFGESRPGQSWGVRTGGGRKFMGTRGGYYNPIRGWLAVTPGAVVGETEVEHELKTIGVHAASAMIFLYKAEIQPRYAGSTDTCAMAVNSGLAEKDLSANATVKLFVLPDLENLPQDKRLQLTIEMPDKQMAAGAPLDFSLTLRNAQNGVVVLEKDLAKYAWYALLDEKGTPQVWGSWHSILSPETKQDPATEAKFLESRELAKNEAAVWKAQLALPGKSGKYALLVFYDSTTEPIEDLREEVLADVLGPGSFRGKLGAKISGIEVKAPINDE